MQHLQAGQVAKLEGLPRDGESARDHGLRGDRRCQRRHDHQRDHAPRWNQMEERIGHRSCVRTLTQQQCPLTKVIEQQTGEDQVEPTASDR